jgi:signal transduction histidine kinase
VRDLSHLLHPSLLDDLGLPSTVDWYLQSFAKRFGIQVAMTQEGMTRRLTPEVELAAYRVVQEALTNVGRHAHASRCRVALRMADGKVEVTVEDDGIGFDQQMVCAMGLRKGLGLLGMRERAAQLKGQLWVQSAPGKGTRVKLELPAAPAPVAEPDQQSEAAHG